MKSDKRLLEELEDEFTLFMTHLRSQDRQRSTTRHARSLHQKAMIALTAGYIDDAIWYGRRELKFSCLAFGTDDPESRQSMTNLEAMKQYAETIHHWSDAN
jgi:hypothetical protein